MSRQEDTRYHAPDVRVCRCGRALVHHLAETPELAFPASTDRWVWTHDDDETPECVDYSHEAMCTPDHDAADCLPYRVEAATKCTCQGYDPADPCGHGDTSEGCPTHDPNYDGDYDNTEEETR